MQLKCLSAQGFSLYESMEESESALKGCLGGLLLVSETGRALLKAQHGETLQNGLSRC